MSSSLKFRLQRINSRKNRPFKVLTRPVYVALTFLLAVVIVSGCAQTDPSLSSLDTAEPTGLILPTQRPTVQPSPVNTRVMSLESLTPAPTATITPIPDETLGLVVEVIDGDTIAVVMDGDPMKLAYQVRYLGIDAPPNDADNPWGVVAYETNRKLANVKVVRLVRDETDFDDEGYLLRYVYVGDMLLNAEMVEQGLAEEDALAPNTRLEAKIKAAETSARGKKLGIWSNQLPTATPRIQPSPAAEETTEAGGEAKATPGATSVRLTVTGTLTATAQITATVQLTGTATQEPTPASTATDTPEPTAESTATAELKGE